MNSETVKYYEEIQQWSNKSNAVYKLKLFECVNSLHMDEDKFRVRTLFWTKNSRTVQGHISHFSRTFREV